MITKYNNLDTNNIEDIPIVNETLNQDEKIILIQTLISSYTIKAQNADGSKMIIYEQIIKMLQSTLNELQSPQIYKKK